MARYSKEQRRRAAELYERYEHSAADVIRELGYPSKEALRMWHREWLEERRTGIPSSRGEHYSRYTDEQRRAAVEHYLTHGRRLSRTIRQMGYPSREVLAAWTGRAGARGARDRTRAGGGRGQAYGGGAAGRGRCDVAAGRGRGGRGGVGREKPGSVNCCTSRYRRAIQ